jgi:AmmeMemoRadiSam system protein B
VSVGSSDLTHYGPRYGMAPVGTGQKALDWTRENDQRILDLIVQMRPQDVVEEAGSHYNACGAGAIAAAMGFAAESGATQGRILHYTTSYDVMPMGRPADMVGYGAVALY